MKEIPLTQGKVALVDDADYEWLNQWKWCASRRSKTWYAVRSSCKIYMHRVIMDSPEIQVDHEDLDGLNNQRANLRLATDVQNQQNTGVSHNNRSGFKGVSWKKSHRKWQAYIRVDGKNRFLGYFDDPEEAKRVRDQSAILYHGGFARS